MDKTNLSRFLGEGTTLQVVGRLQTSGARAAAVFEQEGETWLAVPQLSRDAAGTPGGMNGGDSDVTLPLFRWETGAGFVQQAELPLTGGEDAEPFNIGTRQFLATASGRRGRGPYDANVISTLWERDANGQYQPLQEFETFLAKQIRYFTLAGRHFLGFALGVTVEGLERRHPDTSRIYEWTGQRFELFQELSGQWGYNFAAFSHAGRDYLAYADHVSGSVIYHFDGTAFVKAQDLPGDGGRAIAPLWINGALQLAYATVAGDVSILAWDGAQFATTQVLRGDGGREFAHLHQGGQDYLVLVRFIEGSPKAPVTALTSYVYCWSGSAWEEVDSFPTFGGTDAAFFHADGATYLLVTHSLTPEVTFGQDSAVYAFLPISRPEAS